jgi:hypothetical protein
MDGDFYSRLDSVLCGEGDGYDGLIDNAEILKFLQKWCVSDKDVDAMMTTFKPETGATEAGLKTQGKG